MDIPPLPGSPPQASTALKVSPTPPSPPRPGRRPFLRHAALAAAVLALPAVARDRPRGALAPMTEGPFYPPPSWRQAEPDWDADLTQTRRGGVVRTARGEHLGLELLLVDAQGRPIDRAEVEIWQCDALGAYRHPRVQLPAEQVDAGFQGFGVAMSDAAGRVAFRTIRPVVYPGRTPHIHVRLRHAGTGELTSQFFVAGEAANTRDFLWQQLSAAEQTAASLVLRPAMAPGAPPGPAGGVPPLRWRVQHTVVFG